MKINSKNQTGVLDESHFIQRKSSFAVASLIFFAITVAVFCLYHYWMNPQYYNASSIMPDYVAWQPTLLQKSILYTTITGGAVCSFISYYTKERKSWYRILFGVINGILFVVLVVVFIAALLLEVF